MSAKSSRSDMINRRATVSRADDNFNPAAFDAQVRLEVIRRKPSAHHSRQRMIADRNQYRHDDAGGSV
jgi:hypothetical protein